MDPIIGQICLFAGNFAPKGWAICDGSLLSIAQNSALFAILGTQYGGNGQTTFALPDLRGRVAMGVGGGPGLSYRNQGEQGGTENVTLTANQMPAHTHAMVASGNASNSASPNGALLASAGRDGGASIYSSDTSNQTPMAAQSIQMAGGNLPHNNLQPYLVINYIIAVEGIFPPRN